MNSNPRSEAAVARRAVRAVVTADMEEIERVYDRDVLVHNAGGPDATGIAEVRERALMFAGSLWECSLDFSHTSQNHDVVLTRWVAGCSSGTARSAGSGRAQHILGTSIMRVRDGRVVDDWTRYEILGSGLQMEPAV